MRIANRAGRLVLLGDGVALDVERASGGRFGPDPMDVWAAWADFRAWADDVSPADGEPFERADLGPCVPRPAAVYAIGLNYRDHAEEAGLDVPSTPMVFTKFPTCLAGPEADLPLTSNRVDWEAELVVVMGARARAVPETQALDRVAGYCVGQDISDRRLQFKDKPAQFSLGKSLRGFGPIGPAVTTLDALADPLDLAIGCTLEGEAVQKSRTREMIFNVPELVAFLSRHVDLEPGDLIFTGTPAGVGSVRTPRRYLTEGEQLETEIEGLGVLRNRCVPGGT
ncbi:MAG: fumarylacetoacetate hydrolase family protein [Deltaproteobacteria bacterium]|nr:fumarylacetoacetate hydrolase family protein [Deltaproteobacteria bacterium]MBW2394829.1 fumarylacetoacetate hydrolase family protein [Deltaproteobacteria bacterium]